MNKGRRKRKRKRIFLMSLKSTYDKIRDARVPLQFDITLWAFVV